ncbi:hypothetical protein Ancab_036368 [Ancistrocladus abbreviatus]
MKVKHQTVIRVKQTEITRNRLQSATGAGIHSATPKQKQETSCYQQKYSNKRSMKKVPNSLQLQQTSSHMQLQHTSSHTAP